MAGCSVPGCTNSTSKGFSLRSFPTNRERRRRWICNIGMKWEPTANSRVCEAHFDDNMWEKDRCDGKRKLKCNAVPTIFPPFSATCKSSALSKKNNKDNDGINMLIEILTDEGENKINSQHQLCTRQSEDFSDTTISANVEEEIDWEKQYEEVMQKLIKSQNECEKLRNAMKRREELFNRIIQKSYKCGKVLKKRLKKLREENRTYDKLKTRLAEIFNEDQIKALSSQTVCCREWSEDTIKKAIRLRLACGSAGYQQILDENIPLPSERTLRRKMNSIEKENLDETVNEDVKDNIKEEQISEEHIEEYAEENIEENMTLEDLNFYI